MPKFEDYKPFPINYRISTRKNAENAIDKNFLLGKPSDPEEYEFFVKVISELIVAALREKPIKQIPTVGWHFNGLYAGADLYYVLHKAYEANKDKPVTAKVIKTGFYQDILILNAEFGEDGLNRISCYL